MGELHAVTQRNVLVVVGLFSGFTSMPINGCLETRLGVGREVEGCCANDWL